MRIRSMKRGYFLLCPFQQVELIEVVQILPTLVED
jgi:hypothetical protein